MNQRRLLVLCCHGVYHNGEFYADRPGEKDIYREHIRLAFSLVQQHKYDVLVISGGCTKLQEEKSEARGYLDWADDSGLTRPGIVVLLEEHARTSAENLLFSMCRFYQYYGCFPQEVGSCTLGWKKQWQEQVMAPALHLPQFRVITVEGEEKKLREIEGLLPDPDKVVADNQADPLEMRKDVSKRDIWKKGQPYTAIEQLQPLFDRLSNLREKAGGMSAELFKREVESLEYPWSQR